MDPAYEMVEDLKAEITVNGKSAQKTYKKRDQFAPELVYFSDCILKNKEPQPSGREGSADIRVIEALINSATSNRPVKIAPADVPLRPSIVREISKPPGAMFGRIGSFVGIGGPPTQALLQSATFLTRNMANIDSVEPTRGGPPRHWAGLRCRRQSPFE